MYIKYQDMKSQQYDSCLGYRVMETLRNYMQHRGYPIQGVSFPSKRKEKEKEVEFLFTVEPFIKTNELCEDKKIKKAILEELKSLGDTINVKKMIREYFEALGNIQTQLREAHAEHIHKWDNMLTDAHDRFSGEFPGEKTIALAVVKRIPNGRYRDIVHMFSGFNDYRKHLARKNSILKNISKRYASGERTE